MALRFRGEHVQRTDAKCRLSIPAEFRRALVEKGDNRLMLAPHPMENCIVVHPMRQWEAVEDLLNKREQRATRRNDMTELRAVQREKRRQLSRVKAVETDGHGRVTLPAVLRQYADIGCGQEVMVIGMSNYFELWSPALLERANAADDSAALGFAGSSQQGL